MSVDPYTVALNNALSEIKNICPDVTRSFIFTKEGALLAGDAEVAVETLSKVLHSFQSIAEKADKVGGLNTLLINGKNGKVYVSQVNDMYLAITTSKNADISYLRSVTHVIVPTILKLLKDINPAPLKPPPSQPLIVDDLTGLFKRQGTVEVDSEILMQWSRLLNVKSIDEVEIESVDGTIVPCKVKAIGNSGKEERGLIRIPEKICQMLNVKKGELVKVKPIAQ